MSRVPIFTTDATYPYAILRVGILRSSPCGGRSAAFFIQRGAPNPGCALLRLFSKSLKTFWANWCSTEPSTLTKMLASMDSNRLTGNLSPLESALTKTREGGGGRASDERPRAGKVRAPRYTLAGTLTAANSFSSASPLRNHGRSYRCMYRGSVRFLASSFSAHSRASSRRPASFRKFA